ncbi:DUF6603 domain-containing protein [Archangium violaceum]|uniref:DUF6603 domain-containing protein n=1 Tax=Archangium violaceum TaxID=83451 RepID=UPI00136364ED|nr:DUF6603 domain-containing protein [Archangium violaceum]
MQLNRVGVRYSDQNLWLLFDAALSIGALRIGLEGLGVGSPLTRMEPHFTLHGLEVDYQSEGLEVGASLLRGGVFVYGSRYRRGERVRGV